MISLDLVHVDPVLAARTPTKVDLSAEAAALGGGRMSLEAGATSSERAGARRVAFTWRAPSWEVTTRVEVRFSAIAGQHHTAKPDGGVSVIYNRISGNAGWLTASRVTSGKVAIV